MNIKFPPKFTDKEIDSVVHSIYLNYKEKPADNYIFDLTEVEFIGNQELLLLSAFFKSFIDSNVKFKVSLFKKGIPTKKIPERVKRQIIQIWEVWKIYKIASSDLLIEYFGIDKSMVQRLQEDINYFPTQSEIYTRHGVTPFVVLDYINNYHETEIQKLINPIYKLNNAIEELLTINKCHHPFTSNSLSTIITDELYLNFLDHSSNSSFNGFNALAFMSISFQSKLDETNNTPEQIQNLKLLNFNTESLQETYNFFYDKKNKKYKNIPYVQFSFLDFGQGIVNTLKDQYDALYPNEELDKYESKILRFAFNHDSSRHPIFSQDDKFEKLIPRGLFDALTIVKRYEGLLIIRSNYGKILYDFSAESDIDKAFSYFGDNKLYFPGTLISIYIPAIEDFKKINISSIKPEISFSKITFSNKKYININDIAQKVESNKKNLYSAILTKLKKEICDKNNSSLVFISFKGCDLSARIIKKTIYFLLTDYDINNRNNVVVLNPPAKNIIDEIAAEILTLNEAVKNYKLHPLPIIDFDSNTNDLNVIWLGIYDDQDKVKLNNLLYEQYSIAKSDFKDPANISGHLNEFDSFGNLISNFPNREDIISFYKKENNFFIAKQVENLLIKHNCIKVDDNKSLYLCGGNYYQKQYLDLSNLVNDNADCKIITELLFNKILEKVYDLKSFKLIAVTTTSNKILKALEVQGLIKSEDYYSFYNYQAFENEIKNRIVDTDVKYILICDVISTGFLSIRLGEKLNELGGTIEYIAVISSILQSDFKETKLFLNSFLDKIILLYEYPIVKFKRSEITTEILSKNIIRINPHTNVPIRISINETNFSDSIIYNSEISYNEHSNEININNKFLDNISKDAILVGFYKFNNVIHPYFFNTKTILKNLDNQVLVDIFKKINNAKLQEEKVQIFYPRTSGIEALNFKILRDEILKNQDIEIIEIERFSTSEGWRFPHNSDYLNAKIENNICFILDDGSCSGDSLIQMIDEISFYDAKEIVLLCIVGRVNDHKREFFSRITNIKVKNFTTIPLSIYFASHWHIPTYYLDENPISNEINWLNELISLQNIPQAIKNIARNISKEIIPKNEFDFSDYKYLPKIRNTNGEIPKKELLLIRDEIGKVIGYRLYTESFDFFDCVIKKYENRIASKSRYKEIELLCAIFIYEPYLYEKMSGILPDVAEKIEEFVRILIFNKSIQIEVENEDNRPALTYLWNRKDIIHLFFIVFKNDKLLIELNDEHFLQLIKFTEPKGSAINYVLYKLLYYFPIKPFQFKEKIYDGQLKILIARLKENTGSPSKEIRKFYNFISSLPSRDDFESQLSLLFENYNKQNEIEYHIEKTSFDNNISRIIAISREFAHSIMEAEHLEKSQIDEMREKWFTVLEFVNPILTFSRSFNEYLKPYPYFQLLNFIDIGTDSVRTRVGFIEDVIFSINESYNDFAKLLEIDKSLAKIQLNIKIDSIFHELIKYRDSNLMDLLNGIYNDMKAINPSSTFIGKDTFNTKTRINIPYLYVEKLLRIELITNIKNHADYENLSLCLTNNNEGVATLKIINGISDLGKTKSKGEGIKCLQMLTDSSLFAFKYTSETTKDLKFVQTLIFKTH